MTRSIQQPCNLAALPMMHPDPIEDTVLQRSATDKGNETARNILEQTKNILSESGFSAISIRKVAEKCNINPGNVSYYFKTRDALLEELAKYIFDRWENRFFEKMPTSVVTDLEKFVYSVEYMIQENKRLKTVVVLQEMWAMSNHSPAVMRMMDAFYGRMRHWIEAMLQAVNPDQDISTRQTRAALITAQIEGLMILIGPNRVEHSELSGLEAEAVVQITRLALAE